MYKVIVFILFLSLITGFAYIFSTVQSNQDLVNTSQAIGLTVLSSTSEGEQNSGTINDIDITYEEYLKQFITDQLLLVGLKTNITEESFLIEMNEKQVTREVAMSNLYLSFGNIFVTKYLEGYDTYCYYFTPQISIRVGSLSEQELNSLMSLLGYLDEVGSLTTIEEQLSVPSILH